MYTFVRVFILQRLYRSPSVHKVAIHVYRDFTFLTQECSLLVSLYPINEPFSTGHGFGHSFSDRSISFLLVSSH